MATINIRRDVADPFYRYKMERLQSKIEGKGNGIKTVIVNLSSVAHSLARTPGYVIKYFGYELGAQTNTDPADDRWIINGEHHAAKLQDHLDGFINRFVLCKKCKNPETDFVVKDGRIQLDCKACGQRSDVDLRLRLSGYILKNEATGKKGKKDKGDKKARRAAKQQAASAQQNDTVNGSGSNSDNAEEEEDDGAVEAGSDDELTRRINAEAQEIDETGDVKDEQWAVDVSEEAVKARAKELPDDLKQKLAFDDGDEDGEGDGAGSAYDQLGGWVSETAKEKGDVSKVSSVDVYLKAKELGIETKYKTLTVLGQTIFDERIASQIDHRADMLKKMITSEKHQKAFLGGIERFVGNEHPNLIPQIPKILIPIYQNDLIDEEYLKTWGTRASKKYVDISVSKKVRKAAEPFLQWLETAESDEDSDDE